MKNQLLQTGTRVLQTFCRTSQAVKAFGASAAGASPSQIPPSCSLPLEQAIAQSSVAAFQLASQPLGVRTFQTSAAHQRAQDSDSSETPLPSQNQQPAANSSNPDLPPPAEHNRLAAAAAAATSPGGSDAAANEGSTEEDAIRTEADPSELVTAETGAAGDDLTEGGGDGDYSGDELEDIEASMDEEEAHEDDGYQSEDDMTDDQKLVRSVTTASKKRQRFLLQQLLSGRTGVDMGADQLAMSAEEAQFKEDMADTFNMQVVDINRTTKGMKSGGIVRYGSLVVVGNGNGVLGLGQGKSASLAASISKAYNRAMERLFFIPRFRDHTVYAKRKSKYGRALVYVYPKSAGAGVAANPMVTNICHLAGLQDVGVKVHGSRNPSNTVKALLHALQNSAGENFLGEQSIRAMSPAQLAGLQPEL